MKVTLHRFVYLWIVLTFSINAFAQQPSPQTLEKVTLQLKWFHQFQFAGYYAAKEQGYYAEEGLDVDILERDPKKDVAQQVITDKVDFAIGDSGLLINYAHGEPIVALAAIFQHSPLVFIAKQSSGILSPYEMKGKRIMMDSFGAGSAPLRAVLAEANVTTDSYIEVPQSFRNDDLLEDKFDVMLAYLTDQPFYFQQKKIKINIINPQGYGIDFYGDILFTNQHKLREHPEQVKKFRRATLKGWQYALEHLEEVIQLVHTKYHSKLSIEHLRFEAIVTHKLILPEAIALGQMELRRLQKMADVYTQLKLARYLTENDLTKFIYSDDTLTLTEEERTWLKAHPVIRVGIKRDFAPYEWLDEEGNYKGLVADYFTRFEKLLGIKFTLIKDKTWSEVINMAKQEQLDIVAAVRETPKRTEYLNLTKPYTNNSVVIINDRNLGFIGSLSRLNGKRVALEKDHFIKELLKYDYPNIQLIPADNTKDALQLVATGEADAYVGDAAAANYAIQKLDLLDLHFSGNTEYLSTYSVGVIKKHSELAKIMSKALVAIPMIEQEQINHYWLGIKIFSGISNKKLWQYGLIIGGILLLFIIWNALLRREIVARKKIEQQLRTLFVAIEQSPASVVITDLDAKILYVNPKFTEVTDYSLEELKGKSPRVWRSELTPTTVYNELWDALLQGKVWKGEFINRKKNGDIYWEEAHIAPVKNANNDITHYVGVQLDITERKQVEAELQQAKEEAINANQAKSEFLASMSHEIRTPMNAILGFSQILSSLVTDSAQRYYLQAIETSSKTLLQLINDILDLSKIEARKLEINYSNIDIKKIFDDIHLIFTQKLAEKNVRFSIKIAEDLPAHIKLDEIRFRQILLNIIGNAVKFTHNGFICTSISGKYTNAKNKFDLIIEIEDSGIGIAEDQIQAIFSPFTQQKQQNTQYGGTGLGLTICKRLVEMMNGNISVRSHVSIGSCFTIRFPDVEIVHSSEPLIFKQTATNSQLFHFQPAKLLLVDDIATNRELIKSYLNDYPELTIFEASTAEETLSLVKQHVFDLIFMDRQLPDKDGNQICTEIKAILAYVNIPIIMLSASSAGLPKIEQHFYDTYLNKPVSKKELLAEMQVFLAIDKSSEILQPSEIEERDIDDITIMSTDKIAELVELLSSKYQTQIAQFNDSGAMEIDELIELSEELLNIAEQYDCYFLFVWANTLKNQATLFDVVALPKTIAKFDSLIQQLQSRLLDKNS